MQPFPEWMVTYVKNKKQIFVLFIFKVIHKLLMTWYWKFEISLSLSDSLFYLVFFAFLFGATLLNVVVDDQQVVGARK